MTSTYAEINGKNRNIKWQKIMTHRNTQYKKEREIERNTKKNILEKYTNSQNGEEQEHKHKKVGNIIM